MAKAAQMEASRSTRRLAQHRPSRKRSCKASRGLSCVAQKLRLFSHRLSFLNMIRGASAWCLWRAGVWRFQTTQCLYGYLLHYLLLKVFIVDRGCLLCPRSKVTHITRTFLRPPFSLALWCFPIFRQFNPLLKFQPLMVLLPQSMFRSELLACLKVWVLVSSMRLAMQSKSYSRKANEGTDGLWSMLRSG